MSNHSLLIHHLLHCVASLALLLLLLLLLLLIVSLVRSRRHCNLHFQLTDALLLLLLLMLLLLLLMLLLLLLLQALVIVLLLLLLLLLLLMLLALVPDLTFSLRERLLSFTSHITRHRSHVTHDTGLYLQQRPRMFTGLLLLLQLLLKKITCVRCEV